MGADEGGIKCVASESALGEVPLEVLDVMIDVVIQSLLWVVVVVQLVCVQLQLSLLWVVVLMMLFVAVVSVIFGLGKL